MKIKQLKTNLTLMTTTTGDEYLFSYETLVAGYIREDIDESCNGYWFVGESYSATTTRHIKYYLENLYTSPKTTKVEKSDARLAQSSLV